MEKFQNETKFTYYLSMDPFDSLEQRVSRNNENKSEAKPSLSSEFFKLIFIICPDGQVKILEKYQ